MKTTETIEGPPLTSNDVELEVAYDILTEYLGMLSREISDERGKGIVNERKIAVLQEEREKITALSHSLRPEDHEVIDRVLYLYGLVIKGARS